jgi:hypothetical protein
MTIGSAGCVLKIGSAGKAGRAAFFNLILVLGGERGLPTGTVVEIPVQVHPPVNRMSHGS